MVGGNGQLQRKYMERAYENNCNDVESCGASFGKVPQDIEKMIQEACEHVQ